MVVQILAVIIFVLMFVMIVMDKIERHIVTLSCGLLTLIVVFGLCMHSAPAMLEALNVRSIFTADFWYHAGNSASTSTGINWETILFIAGMMIMVEGMAISGFFRWLCMRIAKLVHYKTIPLLISFMLISSILAMFIDSITVILFLAAVTIELSQLLNFDPVPIILAEIFCANLGGSATMCGDPPNIIIGTSLGYSVADFITNTGVIAGVALIVTLVYFYFAFRGELKGCTATPEQIANMPAPKEAITDKRGFIISCVIFLCAVVLLITHAQTGLTVSTIGIFIAIVTLITSAKHFKEIMSKVDYKTLLFFVGLFVVVSGLEQTGVLKIIANFIGTISGGNVMVMVAIILWISAIASAFVDNIPFAATMIPVIKSLAAVQTGVNLHTLAWALALGTDIGGSATPIGASANVVGTSAAAKSGHPISWGRYCKKVAPATVLVLLVCTAGLFIRYF